MNKQRMKEMGTHIAKTHCLVPSNFDISNNEREQMKDMEVKTWYHECFPTDNLWEQIPSGYTFEGLFKLLDRRKYSYQLFADDSLVRERIFSGLAYAMDVPYSEVYEQWMISQTLDSRLVGDVEGQRAALKKAFEIMNN